MSGLISNIKSMFKRTVRDPYEGQSKQDKTRRGRNPQSRNQHKSDRRRKNDSEDYEEQPRQYKTGQEHDKNHQSDGTFQNLLNAFDEAFRQLKSFQTPPDSNTNAQDPSDVPIIYVQDEYWEYELGWAHDMLSKGSRT